jgi:signal peptidase I
VLTINGIEAHVSLEDGRPVEWLDAKPHVLGLECGNGPDFGPIDVPSGKALVLGDNRGNSRDGRIFGFVPSSAIPGRAQAVVWRDGSPCWIPL